MALPRIPGTDPVGPGRPPAQPVTRWSRLVWLSVAGLLVLALAGALGALIMYWVDHPERVTIPVTRMDLTREVARQGRILPGVSKDVKAPATGVVESVAVTKGQTVAAGDVLAVLSDPGLEAQIAATEADLGVARTRLDEILDANAKATTGNDPEAARLQVRRCELALASRQADVDKLSPKAPIGGRLYDLKVAEGDEVTTGQVLATVVDDSQILFSAQIDQAYSSRVKVGDEAWVTASIRDFATQKGAITEIAKDVDSSRGWGSLTVTVALDPSPLIKSGMKGMAEIRTGAETIYAAGTFRYKDRRDVTAPCGAVVADLPFGVGAPVTKGEAVLVLASEAVRLALEQAQNDLEQAKLTLARTGEVKLPYDQSTIDTQRSRIDSLQATLALRRADLEALTVRAPVDGLVGEVKVQPGDRVAAGALIANVYNDETLRLVVQIDDVDIQGVTPGAKVPVTFEALPDLRCTATVADVAAAAALRDGKGVFDVTLTLPPGDGVVPGMLATARVLIGMRTQVLAVPLAAVTDHNGEKWVRILKRVDGVDRELNVYIRTGLSDGFFVEVLCGLVGNEELIVPKDYDKAEMVRTVPFGAP